MSLYFAEHVRQRVFKLISRAYTSIEADELAAYVGLPAEQAINGESVQNVCNVVC